ncbi:type II toxin-antitoxin system RelE/ParE family toxin [Xanthomonas theicola]|uniref:Plasmid stabilization protein ParE n=1 Tax=Xanthomonas theicola TaxID=56464 RepID=A0A2S6Z6A0_9XANT|nr:type II toxin-antitoxin system RelE/ParE family toxin [Xanthomonas theicola]PPT76865.1 plasmid stabilization protein ParE [Xanthomonas theicola]QNH24716.1 type II toxin-antitoxin system RelE/ParE family toxin [Xanthomonas theicola]
MLPILWRESADADLAVIIDYVGQFDLAAAERLWQLLRASVLPLAEHPYLHPQSWRVPGCREIVVTRNYVVLYRVTVAAVEVVAVVHARREFPV